MAQVVVLAFLIVTWVLPSALYIRATRRVRSLLANIQDDSVAPLGALDLANPSLSLSIAFIRFMWSRHSVSVGDGELRKQILLWRTFAVWTAFGSLLFAGVFAWLMSHAK
jgi:hypothetical protein